MANKDDLYTAKKWLTMVRNIIYQSILMGITCTRPGACKTPKWYIVCNRTESFPLEAKINHGFARDSPIGTERSASKKM
jgi:hypothetical protein